MAPGRTVVDVGAGTGKFTALLVPSGADVVAVEPLAAMREGFVAELAGVGVVEGSAEAMPLANSSADAIVAAQAFHWFDRSRALPEFARVLRPDGRLGVIWNDIDTSVEWASEFYAIVSPGRVATPVPWSAADGELAPWFGPRHPGSFTYAHTLDRGSLLARVDSMSWIAVRPEQEREEIRRRVGELLDTHPELAGRDSFDLAVRNQRVLGRKANRSDTLAVTKPSGRLGPWSPPMDRSNSRSSRPPHCRASMCECAVSASAGWLRSAVACQMLVLR